MFNDDRVRSIQPLINAMKDIGSDHGGKSCAQIAANWVISKGEQDGFDAIPIVGEWTLCCNQNFLKSKLSLMKIFK